MGSVCAIRPASSSSSSSSLDPAVATSGQNGESVSRGNSSSSDGCPVVRGHHVCHAHGLSRCFEGDAIICGCNSLALSGGLWMQIRLGVRW